MEDVNTEHSINILNIFQALRRSEFHTHAFTVHEVQEGPDLFGLFHIFSNYLGVMVHAFESTTRETEAGRSESLMPAWATQRV